MLLKGDFISLQRNERARLLSLCGTGAAIHWPSGARPKPKRWQVIGESLHWTIDHARSAHNKRSGSFLCRVLNAASALSCAKTSAYWALIAFRLPTERATIPSTRHLSPQLLLLLLLSLLLADAEWRCGTSAKRRRQHRERAQLETPRPNKCINNELFGAVQRDAATDKRVRIFTTFAPVARANSEPRRQIVKC